MLGSQHPDVETKEKLKLSDGRTGRGEKQAKEKGIKAKVCSQKGRMSQTY